jgi:hypothetical protein
MENFWEDSPLYRRKQELLDELDMARGARDEAATPVLMAVRMGATDLDLFRQYRAEYLAAYEAWEDVYVAWDTARRAFAASPAGQARVRWLKDPLAPAAPEEQEVA